jgi:hypothetical protein
MAVLSRSLHVTDSDCETGLAQYTRRVENFSNWLAQDTQVWGPTDHALETTGGVLPPSWVGDFDFARKIERGPLQVFVGDSSDAVNTALIGMRLSNAHQCGLLFKPLNVNTVSPTYSALDMSATWTNLWDYSTLKYSLRRGKLVKLITLSQAGHPASFRFAYKLMSGLTASLSNSAISLSNAGGTVVLRCRAPYGRDANGMRIRCTLTAAAAVTYKGVSVPTFRITPNATDLAAATFPVWIDPTSAITGTSAIEDAFLWSAWPDDNFGGSQSLYCDGSAYRSVVRITAGNFPAGTIDAFRIHVAGTSGAANLSAWKIDIVNLWGEGSSDWDTASDGECSWHSCSVDGGASGLWSGYQTAYGCSVSGTDYVANASPPTIGLANGSYTSSDLPASWVSDWRDGGYAPAGMVLARASGTGTIVFCSSENENYPLHFEIDYTAAASVVAGYYQRLINRTRR